MINRNSREFQTRVRIALSRKNFWEYCKFTSPDFYKDDRTFLKEFAETLQWFVEDAEEQILVCNIPPRHGKSRTATKFVQWLFGKYGSDVKVMTGSYNETLSETFAKAVRDTIATEKSKGVTVFSDIFPGTKIKYGSSAVKKWALEGSEVDNYLATSPTGTATGFGCNIMIIDDIIKNAKEAYNENVLKSQISWFTDTMMSRLETGFKIIIVMTRWASEDLSGYIIENYDNVVNVNYKAVNDDGSMLCPEILSKEDFLLKTKNMNKDIVSANYQQEPLDIKGKLYTTIKTYSQLPSEDGVDVFDYKMNYTDTADEGKDYLCSICYTVYKDMIYITDVLYTHAPMEITEPAMAEMLIRNGTKFALVESNNGGRGFARQVQRELKERAANNVIVKWMFQRENKISRILSNSTGVMNDVLFPVDWETRWYDFAKAIKKYQRTAKNEHDDAPDALTGVYEHKKPNGWLV